MVILLITVSVSVFLGFLLLWLVLTGRSPEETRLMEVTSGTQGSSAAMQEMKRTGSPMTDQLARLAEPLRKMLGSSPDSELVRRLASAGYRRPTHADVFYLAKTVLPIFGALVTSLLVKNNIFFWVIFAAALGFLLPDLWLMQKTSSRQEHIRLSLPDSLDLLVICMEAGLGLDQALVRVGQELKISHPALSEEFLIINLEQRAGKPRLEAWRNMAERTGVDSVRQFVHMLVQTERFGTPISKSLGAYADSLRVRRRQQAEEMAAKTTIKMIPPLVIFIMPSLFIVLLGPAIITIIRSMATLFQ